MLGGLTSRRANMSVLHSRRAMLDTLLKHLPMVRLSVGALAALLFMGCSGLIDGGDENVSAEEQAARAAFISKAKPVFDNNCAACHAGSDPTVAFLQAEDSMAVRAKLLGSDYVNLEAPQSSRLLTKGAHSGPALIASQASDLLEWLAAERDAAGVAGTVDTGLETQPFTPVLCTSGNPGDPTCPITYVDITGLIEGWGGAKIKFVAQPLSLDLYVTNLALEGGPEGVYIEHPLFVSWPAEGDPIPDKLDRFFNVKMNLMAGAMPSQINGGTAAFIDFAPNNQLTIHFKVVDRFRPDEGGGGGGMMGATGCKSLATFKTNARAPLQTNCASCHANAGNVNARGAMDITGIAAADDATLQNVCNQARTRINFQDTNASGFYIAPNPAMGTNHPFKFAAQANFDTFKAAVDIWVQAEKTAQ
jgi:mono/diheme cytochrome c family protein